MNKKKITFLSSLLLGATALVAGIATNANGSNLGSVHADGTYSIKINRETVGNHPWIGDYVTTGLGNEIYISNLEETGDAIYSMGYTGTGVYIDSEIQEIVSVAVTYQLPSDELLGKGGLTLHLSDDPTFYAGGVYDEEFDLTNASAEKQTQSFVAADPTQCHYVALWFTSIGNFGDAAIFEIVVNYRCA